MLLILKRCSWSLLLLVNTASSHIFVVYFFFCWIIFLILENQIELSYTTEIQGSFL
jgi:hypothetical protein